MPMPMAMAMASIRSQHYSYLRVQDTRPNGEEATPDDLDAMVRDFVENGNSSNVYDTNYHPTLPKTTKLLNSLQMLKSCTTATERMIQSAINLHTSVFTIKDSDSISLPIAGTKMVIVKQLQCSGYNAAICKSKWPYSEKLQGGEYEYIDIVLGGDEGRVIVDIDFQSEFEIARPTPTYKSLLKTLPVIFIGHVEKLEQVLKVMAKGAKQSLKQNSMSLPPWRTYAYMSSKWMSPHQRTST